MEDFKKYVRVGFEIDDKCHSLMIIGVFGGLPIREIQLIEDCINKEDFPEIEHESYVECTLVRKREAEKAWYEIIDQFDHGFI